MGELRIPNKILVVENHYQYRIMIANTLSVEWCQRGVKVILVGSGKEALEVIRREDGLMALVTEQTPEKEISGIEIIKAAKEKAPEIKCALITEKAFPWLEKLLADEKLAEGVTVIDRFDYDILKNILVAIRS